MTADELAAIERRSPPVSDARLNAAHTRTRAVCAELRRLLPLARHPATVAPTGVSAFGVPFARPERLVYCPRCADIVDWVDVKDELRCAPKHHLIATFHRRPQG